MFARKVLIGAALVVAIAGSVASKDLRKSDSRTSTQGKAAPAPLKETKPAVTPPDAASSQNPIVAQARDAGLKSCLKTIGTESAAVQTDYAVVSNWAQTAPDEHLFESVLSMAQPGSEINRTVGMLVAAPTTHGCDTTAVHVMPIATGCDTVRAQQTKNGRAYGDFGGLMATSMENNSRQILVPAGPATCVLMTVTVHFDQSK